MRLTSLGALGYALVSVYLWFPQVASTTVNRTIDDQLGDSVTGLLPIYSPTRDVWDTQACIKCTAKVDVSQAFMGTYLAATYSPDLTSMGISMQFNGTAIYVFFILANNRGEGLTSITNVNFTIDGGAPTPFIHTPKLSTTTFQHDALVFSQTNLSNTLHTLNITIMVSMDMYVNFDYAIYTHEKILSPATSVPQKSSTDNAVLDGATLTTSARISVGAIAGAIAAGIAALVLVIFITLYWHCQPWGSEEGSVEDARIAGVELKSWDMGAI